MAEFVQQNIEDMLPELEFMEQVQLFSGKEVKSILKKRKTFEYRLRRKTKQKDDYIQYIQYEMDVLDLVKKRRHRMGYKHKRLEIDVPIEQRIHRLFRMACFRFQDDVKIWLSHIKFCKMRSKRSGHGAKALVSDLYSRMLQVHNRKPGLWIKSAKHEMEVCQSMDNARAVLQRGLRFNPNDKLLWIEYFRLELLNAEKLNLRKEVLSTPGVEEEAVSDEVLGGKVAEVVYHSAVQNFPEDVEFKLAFLPVCRIFPFAKDLEEVIFKDIECVNTELTWHATATRYLYQIEVMRDQPDSNDIDMEIEEKRLEDKCFEVLEQAVQKLCTEQMYDKYLEVCLERLALDTENSLQIVTQRRERCLRVFGEASTSKCLSENMALKWLTFLSDLESTDEALDQALDSILSLHPSSLPLLHSATQYYIATGKKYAQIYTFFTQALNKVKVKESLPLWKLMYQWLRESHTDKLETFLQLGVTQCTEICLPVKLWYLQHMATEGNINKVRDVFKRVTAFPPVDEEIYQTYIDIELEQDPVTMKRVRAAYEDAVREFGTTSSDIWLSYIRCELTVKGGRPEGVGDLYARAVKTLEGELNERFLTQYTLLQTGHL